MKSSLHALYMQVATISVKSQMSVLLCEIFWSGMLKCMLILNVFQEWIQITGHQKNDFVSLSGLEVE